MVAKETIYKVYKGKSALDMMDQWLLCFLCSRRNLTARKHSTVCRDDNAAR
jgi:hypothetical protein